MLQVKRQRSAHELPPQPRSAAFVGAADVVTGQILRRVRRHTADTQSTPSARTVTPILYFSTTSQPFCHVVFRL
jgi:hypothetical protein